MKEKISRIGFWKNIDYHSWFLDRLGAHKIAVTWLIEAIFLDSGTWKERVKFRLFLRKT